MPPNRTAPISAKFTGTATPDPSNAGRYTLELAVAVAADPVNFDTVIYQASGGLLFWLDESANGYSVSLEPSSSRVVGRAAGGQKGSGENPIEKEAIADNWDKGHG